MLYTSANERYNVGLDVRGHPSNAVFGVVNWHRGLIQAGLCMKAQSSHLRYRTRHFLQDTGPSDSRTAGTKSNSEALWTPGESNHREELRSVSAATSMFGLITSVSECEIGKAKVCLPPLQNTQNHITRDVRKHRC